MGMGAAFIAITAISAAYSAYAQRAAGAMQAAIARRNAEMEELAAQDAEAVGREQASRLAIRGGQIRGSQIAAYAASGVVPTSGSALDVLSDTAMFTALDMQIAQSNAARQAWMHRAQAGNWKAQSRLSRFEGNTQAISTLLSGSADVMSMSSAYSKVKPKKGTTTSYLNKYGYSAADWNYYGGIE